MGHNRVCMRPPRVPHPTPSAAVRLQHVLRFLVLCLAGYCLPSDGAAFSAAQLDSLPPASREPVDFVRDVQPILEASCVKCHGRGKDKGGFRLDTRETLLKESDSGPAVVAGKSRDSLLIHLVAGLDPDNVMPVKGSRLNPAQIGLLRAWIDQGMPWDSAVSFAREPHRNLQPRKPELPPAISTGDHPVDRLMASYFQRHGVQPAAPVDDRTFARRTFLDVVGLLPTPEELGTFLADTRPDRRERLVASLLGDAPRYAQHWMSFWNDLLRNDYRGTGYIDGGREPITPWLYAALRDNMPYDRFVRELVNPGDGPAKGFAKGIVWRGVVNSSQTPQMQAAQNISQVFLGVNLKCASCHDSFIDDWQLSDAYGMAGVYASEKLELVQCDKPLGRHAPTKFLFPELGGIDDDAPRAERIARLAELVTTPANGRLPRTVVNRLWARLLGRGLVEPLDVMQNPAWNPDLLDWLAEDLVAHGYDLKRTLSVILTSRAYQLPAVDVPEVVPAGLVFRGPAVRRLSAEQFRDALGQMTGVWAQRPEGGLESLLVEKGPDGALPAAAYWVWSDAHAASAAPPQTVWFRRTFVVESMPDEAVAVVNADNSVRLWVNGQSARRQNNTPWNETVVVDVKSLLKPGTNVLAAEAVNGGEGPNPAGLLLYARFRGTPSPGTQGGERPPATGVADFGTDGSWRVSTVKAEGWMKPQFDDAGWGRAQVLGPADMAPWGLGTQFVSTVRGRTVFGAVRASLVSADPLATALGRPNREQVTSQRAQTATTIQLLELTNGGTLAGLLRQGAGRLVAEAGVQGPETGALVDRVFRQALGRGPTPQESELAAGLLGARPRAEGVEDLLWSVAMLPEFQLVY